MFVVMMAMVMQAQEIITTQPEGTLKTYDRSGMTINKDADGVKEIEASKMNVVYANDGETVYIQDPLSGFSVGTWVKGTLSGNTITVPTGQQVYTLPYTDQISFDYKVGIMKKVATSDGSLDYEEDESVTSYSYTIDGDNMVLNGTSTDGSVILGVSASAMGTTFWGQYGDFNVSYSLSVDQLITMPESVSTVEYSMDALNSDGNQVTGTVKVAHVGNEIYMQGLYADFPAGVVKGTVDAEGNVTFPKNLFLGAMYGFSIYLTGTIDGSSMEDVVFAYDAGNNRYTLQTPYMIFNTNKNSIEYIDLYKRCVLNGPQTNGIEKAEVSQDKPGSVAYYNLKGQRLSAPVKGVVIRKTVSEDGKVKVAKVQMK